MARGASSQTAATDLLPPWSAIVLDVFITGYYTSEHQGYNINCHLRFVNSSQPTCRRILFEIGALRSNCRRPGPLGGLPAVYEVLRTKPQRARHLGSHFEPCVPRQNEARAQLS
jgi:hypothetical protein